MALKGTVPHRRQRGMREWAGVRDINCFIRVFKTVLDKEPYILIRISECTLVSKAS